MIINFEDQTFELTTDEVENIVPFIKNLIKEGKANAITNKDIIHELNHWNMKSSAPRIRKIIQYIRLTGQIERLMATSKGYYISNDDEELKTYIESLMQRSDQIAMLAKQMDYQRKKLSK